MNKIVLLLALFLLPVGAHATSIAQAGVGATSGTSPSAGAVAASSEGEGLQELYDSYSKFDFGSSMNWGDCLDFKVTPSVGICPGIFPYVTPVAKFSYKDIVAMVEVVPDAWRSFLYDESLYDFSGKAESALASKLGVTPGIGGGYGNRNTTAKEFQGQHKLESHVWAISDLSRFKTSSKSKACRSLTCKNKDWTGCLQVVVKAFQMASSMATTVNSLNENNQAGPKGQGVKTGDGQVAYENGEVWEERIVRDPNGNIVGKEWTQVRPEGNYGFPGLGTEAGAVIDWSMQDSPFPGMSNADMLQAGMVAAQNPSAGLAAVAGSAASDAWEGSELQATVDEFKFWESDEADGSTGGQQSPAPSVDKDQLLSGGGDTSLPSSTMGGGSYDSERVLAGQGDFGNQSLSQSAGTMSNSAFNSPQQNAAAGGIMGAVPGIGGAMGSKAFDEAIMVVDMIQNFNVPEILIQMIATSVPLMIHPVYMTERHDDTIANGGFVLSNIYNKFAQMGAGVVMPVFCMSNTAIGAGQGMAGLLDFDLPDIGGLISFVQGRCIGSWGPVDPRINLLGTGDNMVAAGLAAVRTLDIAQNVTGGGYNKSINNTPFTQLSFNLDWPHKSDCYNFQGFDALSRGWETPINSATYSSAVTSAVKGDMAGLGNIVGQTTVGNATKQGGYVFTFWRKRNCRYLIGCKQWRGDAGGV